MILMINNLPFKFGVEIECFGCKRIDIKNELDKLNIEGIDKIFILHDLYSIKMKEEIKDKVIKKVKGE